MRKVYEQNGERERVGEGIREGRKKCKKGKIEKRTVGAN
jgi:hypothetical protein